MSTPNLVSYRPYRLEISGLLKPCAPFHIGTGERLSLLTDDPVLREGNDPEGLPYIPGTSLRGVLRSHLEREAPLLGCSQAAVERLFGPKVSSGVSAAQIARGRLFIADALPVSGVTSCEFRDHVRIRPEWNAADYGAKFDNEVVLAEDAAYKFFAVYEGDGRDDEELLLLRELVRYLCEGELRVGAKAGWGYGRMELTQVSYREFDRRQPQALADYLRYRAGNEAPVLTQFEWPNWKPLRQDGVFEPFSELQLTVLLQFEGPVLVKAAFPPEPPGEAETGQAHQPERYGEIGWRQADQVFVTTAGGRHYLPGSSLRGVLRRRAERICRTLLNSVEIAEVLFGAVRASGGQGHKGLIEVFDGLLCGSREWVYLDHVAIDRITNAAVDAKKFANCALASPLFRTEIRVRFTGQNVSALALFAFLLRDLMEGWCWAGSGTSRGYGHIEKATCENVRLNLLRSLGWSPGDCFTQIEYGRPGRCLYHCDKVTEFSQLNGFWRILDEHWNCLLTEIKGEQ